MNDPLFDLLITQLGQVSLVAAAVWLVVRMIAKDRPHLAHVLWALVIIKCLTPPIWCSPTSPFCWGLFDAPAMSQADRQSVAPAAGGDGRDQTSWDPVTIHVGASSAQGESSTRSVARDSRVPVPAVDAPPPPLPTRTSFFVVLFWVVGSAVGIGFTIFRWLVLFRWLRIKSESQSPSDFAVLLRRLRRQLNIRRSVRIRILDRPVGPAVIGIFRPVILLPRQLVQGKTEASLVPLITHELIHIRRGDLVWSMLQSMAVALFWFHPLVWLASRRLTREAERSCDEETIASLGCPPAEYARSLLDVLEQKHQLRVAPALPGVRPVDITSARLERVMRLGKGIHKRTPLRIWLAVVLLGAIVLPGAAAVVPQQQEEVKKKDSTSQKQESRDNTNVVETVSDDELDSDSQVESDQRLVRREYDVQDLLDRLHREIGVPVEMTSAELLRRLPTASIANLSHLESTTSRNTAPVPQPSKQVLKQASASASSNSSADIQNGNLVLTAIPQVHQRVKKRQELYREFGFKQVITEVRLISLSPALMQTLDIGWELGGAGDRALEAGENKSRWTEEQRLNQNGSGISAGRPEVAATYVETQQPLLFAILDAGQVKSLMQKIEGDAKWNVTQAPTVCTANGQTANIIYSTAGQSVVGMNPIDTNHLQNVPYSATHRVIDEGSKIEVTPTIDGDKIHFECSVSVTSILGVEEQELRLMHEQEPVRLRIPKVATSRIQVSQLVPEGKTLAVALRYMTMEREEGELLSKEKQGIFLLSGRVSDELGAGQSVSAAPDSNERTSQPGPVEVVKIGEREIRISGNAKITTDGGRKTIRGRNLEISDTFEFSGGEWDLQIAGEEVEVDFECEGLPATYRFRGNARLRSEGGELDAEEVEVVFGHNKIRVASWGSVKFESRDPIAYEVAADRFIIDNEKGWTLIGNARLRGEVNGTPLDLRGDRIFVDEESGKVSVEQDD